VNRHPISVKSLRELVSDPIFFGEAEVTNRMTIEGKAVWEEREKGGRSRKQRRRDVGEERIEEQ